MIKRSLEIEISISPQELAKEFCEMDSESQAIFFEEIYRITKTWDKPFYYQLHYIATSSKITKNGLHVMRSIGLYAENKSCEKKAEDK